MAEDRREQPWDACFVAEIQVGMADTGGFYSDQDLIVAEIFIHLNFLKLEWCPWLRHDESVGKHYDGE